MPTGKCPLIPPSAPLRPELGPPQKCRLSLSMHFPCSKQAGGQQGLSRLSDRGAERPRGKVFSQSAVRRSSAPLKCSHLAAPSSETVQLHMAGPRDSEGRAAFKATMCLCSCPLICWCSFCSFVTQMTKTNKSITEKDRRLGSPPLQGAREALARVSVLCGLFAALLCFAHPVVPPLQHIPLHSGSALKQASRPSEFLWRTYISYEIHRVLFSCLSQD